MNRPMPLHLQDWEAEAMFAGAMNQKRVPTEVRWTPKGKTQSIVSMNPLAKAEAGARFWIAESHTHYTGKGTAETFEVIEYSSGAGETHRTRFPRVKRWRAKQGTPRQMPEVFSRMRVTVVSTIWQQLLDISDTDVVVEGMLHLDAERPRSRFYADYTTAYGPEFARADKPCVVVRFSVERRDPNSSLHGWDWS